MDIFLEKSQCFFLLWQSKGKEKEKNSVHLLI